MITAFDMAAFERGTDALLQFFTVEHARALVAYRGDEAIRAGWKNLRRRATRES